MNTSLTDSQKIRLWTEALLGAKVYDSLVPDNTDTILLRSRMASDQRLFTDLGIDVLKINVLKNY